MRGRCERRRCQTSIASQLEVELAVWNSVEAEIMGGQGFTAGCSAVAGKEWQVLLFNPYPATVEYIVNS